jgi:hypothetical protein
MGRVGPDCGSWSSAERRPFGSLGSKKWTGNFIAVGIAPSKYGIYVPALAFENYMIASEERAIFARSPFIASRAL